MISGLDVRGMDVLVIKGVIWSEESGSLVDVRADVRLEVDSVLGADVALSKCQQ